MKKDRKIETQGTGKEENKVDNIRPDTAATAERDDTSNAGVAAQMQGEDMNEGNQVTEDKTVGDTDRDTTGIFNNNNTTNNYEQEVDVNAGGVAIDKSPGATNKGNNPSNTDLATAALDYREAVRSAVDEDAEKQTGRPTGAIYGSGGEIIAVSNPADSKSTTQKPARSGTKKKATPSQTTALTRIFGHLHKEDSGFFIKAGNVPEGQVQLLAPKEMEDRLGQYDGQLVSVAGAFSKRNKADKYASLSIRQVVSHEEIGHRAYALSQQNPAGAEDNWLKAEDELLQE